MRLGQLPYNTATEILDLCKNSYSRSLAWTSPLLPVIPAIRRSRIGLDLSRAARPNQLLHALNDAACAGGMINRAWTHDLRRGAAKDLKHVHKVEAGVRPEVASALGHSKRAYNDGTTDAYGERETFFLNSAKEQSAIADGERFDPFGPKFALEPYRKPILKPIEITEYIQRNPGLSRAQASSRIHKDLKHKWLEVMGDDMRRGVQPGVLREKSVNSLKVIAKPLHQLRTPLNLQ
jgi:hypothetical protein